MPTATETGIDRQALHAKMQEGGLRHLDQKMGRGPAGPEAGKQPEKRRVKNQAEIDRVKRENERIRGENERIERQRTEIAGAVNGALDLVSRKLSGRNLSEKDGARLTWVKNSTKGALDKLERGKYPVEIKEGEKVTESRQEGLPTEALIDTSG